MSRAPAESPTQRPRYVIQSLARGLSLFDHVRASTRPLSLVDLSKHAGLGLVTTFRLMYTLEQAGYVRRDPETRRYHVAASGLELTRTNASLFDYVQAATPYLEELRDKVGDEVGLAVLEGTRVRNLTRLFYSRLMADSLRPGSLLAAHATSLGKVLLGSLAEAQIRELYADVQMERCTPHTLTTVDRLIEDVNRARRLGYAISINEHKMGVRSAAAPVKDARGSIVAAITILTLAPNVTRRMLAEDYAPLAIMAADATSARLAAMVGA